MQQSQMLEDAFAQQERLRRKQQMELAEENRRLSQEHKARQAILLNLI
jgi:hypothetical protein